MGMTITQAIETRGIGASNTRGSRIKATAWAGSITVPYDYELSEPQNHAAAALALIAKLEWEGQFAQGGNAKGNGYYFVNVKGALA